MVVSLRELLDGSTKPIPNIWCFLLRWWLLGIVLPPRIFRRMDERFLQFYSLTAGIGILLQPEIYL